MKVKRRSFWRRLFCWHRMTRTDGFAEKVCVKCGYLEQGHVTYGRYTRYLAWYEGTQQEGHVPARLIPVQNRVTKEMACS